MADEQLGNKRHSVAPIILAAGAAAAGYYFYGSKNAAANRKKAAKWADELKSEVMQSVRALPRVDERTVAGLVDAAAASYAKLRSVRKDDVARAAKELRSNWRRLVTEARAGVGRAAGVKPRKRTTKKTVRSRKR